MALAQLALAEFDLKLNERLEVQGREDSRRASLKGPWGAVVQAMKDGV